MLRALKRLGLFLAIGGLLGAIVTLVVAPSALTWFQTPGTGTAICNCADVARQTAQSFVKAELIGTGAGAVGFAIIAELFYHLVVARRRQRAIAADAPRAAAPPEDSSAAGGR